MKNMRPVSVYETSQPAGNGCSFLTVGMGAIGAAVLFELVDGVGFDSATFWVTTELAAGVVAVGGWFWFVCF